MAKPDYSENVVDVDGLEKIRLHEEAETTRKVALEQELTKREAIKQKEETKRTSGYSNLRVTLVIAFALGLAIAAVAGAINTSQYLDVLKLRAEAQAPKCPPPPPAPKCPEVTCQAVPVPVK